MQPVSRCQFALQGKGKKPFIDKHAEGTAHFHLVHRSQRDPKAADPEAPQRVLIPGELGQRKGTSQIDSIASSRAWLAPHPTFPPPSPSTSKTAPKFEI